MYPCCTLASAISWLRHWLYRVFIVHVYTACLYICMHSRMFKQIYASAIWVKRLALSLHFANLSCLCSAVSAARRPLSFSCRRCSLFSLSCQGFKALLEVFRICMFTTTSITTIKSDYKSVRTCSQLDHARSVRKRRAYACTGRTYSIYIYIREILPFNSLVWGPLTLAPITKRVEHLKCY